MSTTATKRSLAEADTDAEAFRELFAGTYVQWHVAGSVRRRRPAVCDVEHVVVPKFGDAPVVGGLFVEQRTFNLLLARADLLVQDGIGGHPNITRHVYSDGRQRWGERHRGLSFRGFAHELFLADRDNWGSTLAIRTGPSEFSRRLVTGLLKRELRNDRGYVWRCDRCPCRSPERLPAGSVPDCGGTGLLPVERLSVPTEWVYFELCGIPWTEPEDRR